MASDSDLPVRSTDVCLLQPGGIARGQRFFVQWLQAPQDVLEGACSQHEMLLLLPEVAGARLFSHGISMNVPGRSVNVLPPGPVSIELADGARAALIASSRADLLPGSACNEADYRSPDERILPSDAGYRRLIPLVVPKTFLVDEVAAPVGNPRLKMFQSETLSINWVEYQGARDRTRLSPHSHSDFEQGSLAMAGAFVHHLRVAWGKNADSWREDKHLCAPSPSMLTIPLNLIHTTEGVGDGGHLLVDVFSPPRPDFIGKGWVANAHEYACVSAAQVALARP